MSQRINKLRDDERGWALVTAIIVISLMLAVGLAIMSSVDTQTNVSLKERTRESSFNLSEAALQNQGYLLGANWPGQATQAYPTCTQATGANALCPDPANLSGTAGNGSFNLADYKASTTWKIVVRDNGNPASDFYSSAVDTTPCTGSTTVPCSWDANGDNKLWVRAQAIVRGKPRTIVALLKREKLNEPFPRTAITAGHASTCCGNAGKTLINGTGSQLVVRCTDAPGDGSNCFDYGNSTQVQGPVVQAPTTPSAMDAGQILRFKAMAQANSTYFNRCLTDESEIRGPVTFIDPPLGTTSCPAFNGNTQIFSQSQPGIVIQTRGTFGCHGGIDYWGVLYMTNADNVSSDVVDVQGNCVIHGSVVVDGNGGISAGDSGGNAKDGNILFDPNAFGGLYTFGTAGLVQNTWRELPPLG